MKYTVVVKEISYGTVKVEAISEEDALRKAETEYAMGNTVWDRGEHELLNVECTPSRKRIFRCFEQFGGKQFNG